MDFRPNIDAVRWFCATCWPRIARAHPGATFAIVGRNPTAAVRALAALPGVRVTGAVPDTRPWVAGAEVYVVPMRIGGGVRLKLLQALAMGRAIVSTRMGAEGITLDGGRDLLLADGPADFADAVLAPPGRSARADGAGPRGAHRRRALCLGAHRAGLRGGAGGNAGGQDAGRHRPSGSP